MKEFFEARFQALKEYLSSITEGFSTIGIITEIIDIILVIALIVFIIYSLKKVLKNKSLILCYLILFILSSF